MTAEQSADLKIFSKPLPLNGAVLMGFPGSGLVGTIALQYMVDQMEFELVGSMTSKFFPPLAMMNRGIINDPVRLYTKNNEKYNITAIVADIPIAPMICYEIAYPDLVRQIAARSDVLATISNDGWFGATMGPHQHFQMVRMRALENGREVIRATNNGISAIIDARGHVREEAPQFQRLVLRADVHGYRGLTPFMIVGSVPALAACALMLVISRRRGRALPPTETRPAA